MELSIVTTLYNSGSHIQEFYERISDAAKKITNNYELIFVNDGSPDNSLETVLPLYEIDKRIRIIDLSRNFGHHKAIMTGLSYSLGDYVFLIDSDLEESPELLETFWKKMLDSKGMDVVFGVQEKRRGGWFERVSGLIFYKVINFLSDVKIPPNFLTVRLMTQRYVQNLVRFQERENNFSTLTELAGFNKKPIAVRKGQTSPSNYNLFKKFSLLVNAVTSSSNHPLWVIFYLGLAITLVSLAYIFKLIFLKVTFNIGVDGWTSVMVSIFFFGGLIIFVLGIIGVYLSKIFIETKQRPNTIVKQIYDNPSRK